MRCMSSWWLKFITDNGVSRFSFGYDTSITY